MDLRRSTDPQLVPLRRERDHEEHQRSVRSGQGESNACAAIDQKALRKPATCPPSQLRSIPRPSRRSTIRRRRRRRWRPPGAAGVQVNVLSTLEAICPSMPRVAPHLHLSTAIVPSLGHSFEQYMHDQLCWRRTDRFSFRRDTAPTPSAVVAAS